MSETDLVTKRNEQVKLLHQSIQDVMNYYNDNFSGNSNLQKQNESIDNILGLVSSLQGSVLAIRDYNSRILMQRRTIQQYKRLELVKSAYERVSKSMKDLSSVMTLGDEVMPMVDNTDYGDLGRLGEHSSANVASDEDTSKNFNQPADANQSDNTSSDGVSSALESFDSELDGLDIDASSVPPVEINKDAVDHKDHADMSSDYDTSAVKSASAVKNASANQKNAEAEQQTEERKASKPNAFGKSGESTPNVSRVSESDGPISAEAEYELHRQRALAEKQKKAAKDVHSDLGMAIRWPDADHYVTKNGHVLSNNEIRDVTPKHEKEKRESDKENIDDILQSEMNKL